MTQHDTDSARRPPTSGRHWQVIAVVLALGAASAVAFVASRYANRARPPTPATASASPLPQPKTPANSGKKRTDAAAEPTSLTPDPALVVPNHPTRPPASNPLAASASRSVGTPQTGHLEVGSDIAVRPSVDFYVLPATAHRKFTFATAELVRLLTDVASTLRRSHKDAVLALGNLSRAGGGDIPQSVSHNSGRDADIAFFALGPGEKPVRLQHMLHFDENGTARDDQARTVRFDVERNWEVVRSLLSHPAVVVQWIFVAAPLRNMLLDHALRIDESELLQERARRVLVQPSDSAKHDDHFHVRIACPPDDRPGCIQGSGRTKMARDAQIDALLQMYHRGSPAERRYARDMLSLPVDGADLILPPLETP